MSYPKTLGELWDMGPEAAEALEEAEHWEREANERTLQDEIADEQAQWMRDTLQELWSLTNLAYCQSERSPHKVRDLVKAVLDACQADY